MSAAEREVRQRLRTIPEPCSLLMRTPMDICQMGIVGPVECSPDGAVKVELVLTDASCIHFSALQRYITDAVLAISDVTQVTVSASTSILWTPDRMSGHADVAAAAASTNRLS
jgi:metal-sulfur cluster biosynthetic enzyme